MHEEQGKKFVTITDGNGVPHKVSTISINEMIGGFDDMQEFWEGKSPAERGAYIKSHYLSGTTHKPWERMTAARLTKICKRIRKGQMPINFIEKRATDDFLNKWGYFGMLYDMNDANHPANKFQQLLYHVYDSQKPKPKKKRRILVEPDREDSPVI